GALTRGSGGAFHGGAVYAGAGRWTHGIGPAAAPAWRAPHPATRNISKTAPTRMARPYAANVSVPRRRRNDRHANFGAYRPSRNRHAKVAPTRDAWTPVIRMRRLRNKCFTTCIMA